MLRQVLLQELEASTTMADQEGAEAKMNPDEAVSYRTYKHLAILNHSGK